MVRTLVALTTVAALLPLGLLQATPATAQEGRFPTLSDQEAVQLYDALEARLGGTVRPGAPPAITGSPQADARIRSLAEARGYRLRTVATAGLESVGGVLLQPEAAAAWRQLQAAAARAGHSIAATSGYRSPDLQRSIFLGKLAGWSTSAIASGAADGAIESILRLNSIPGYSKHHSGYTIDVVTSGGSLGGFASTPAYAWLVADNYRMAKSYGFLPSYPAGATNLGPNPEPWEYVYVGIDRIKCAEDAIGVADPGTAASCPIGALDVVTVQDTAVAVAGWATDRDAGAQPIIVRLEIDGAPVFSTVADAPRPDIDSFLGIGAGHGFEATVFASPGAHMLCAVGQNAQPGQPERVLGCKTFAVTTQVPLGALDAATIANGSLHIRGWAADPDQPASTLPIHIYVNGTLATAISAASPRPDVHNALGLGTHHGYTTTLPIPPGPATICTYAISPQPGEPNPNLGCRSVT